MGFLPSGPKSDLRNLHSYKVYRNPQQCKHQVKDDYFSESDLIELTYTQCFNYYNWQGAIKTPACVKYASRLAYFVQTALQKK